MFNVFSKKQFDSASLHLTVASRQIKLFWIAHLQAKIAEKSRGLVRFANEYVILDENETKSLIKQIDKLPEKLNKHELMKALLSQETEYAEVVIDEKLNDLVNTIKKNTTTVYLGYLYEKNFVNV